MSRKYVEFTMIREVLKDRILILDGAMGTVLQHMNLPESTFRGVLFRDAKIPLKGNNDVLNLSAPEIIKEIHSKYIEAGADIITTNTFNSNAISQKKYGCEDRVREMNFKGASIARECATQVKSKRIWVAGSMGPTSCTLSLSPDMAHPEYRDVDFDEMSDAYYVQAEALISGGADLILMETCFDALNTKAALYAIERLNRSLGREIPVMVSATINDKSGRLLTGQTLEAFYTSISHYPVVSFGLNCSFGVSELRQFIESLSSFLPCYTSIHPNAGLPNEMGEYEESPEMMAGCLRDMAEASLINIAGGCCGTTYEHIAAISDALRGIKPRIPKEKNSKLYVSGLEITVIDKEFNFVNIGERTNVAGSRKFARLISEKKYEEAASVAAGQIEDGASVIDINMDDGMLDGSREMRIFTRYISNEPSIARAAVMIDSSEWNTVLEGLKNCQGKCIVNSISLKEGEEEFLRKACELHDFGAAVVVMAFDENGQATTYERKIEICKRAYTLLTERTGIPPQDIIFDVNVLSVGTGIEVHANYGIDFIKAVKWIKENLPYAKTSGGISNLSFSFRGNNPVREAMHSVFLYHAIQAGLDMAIVNPSMLQVYDTIDSELLKCCEDVILNRNANATENLVKAAAGFKDGGVSENSSDRKASWRTCSVEERLAYALCKGISDYIAEDVNEAMKISGNPVDIIEGPLMRGMEKVGNMFGEGKMFLPQVVKSAKVMKSAVAVLEPAIESMNAEGKGSTKRPKVVIATVKGDVHDIGKNIVAIVLGCNNFDVIDLGVMVDGNIIVDTAIRERADIIAVSGLITPSLKEMENLCRMAEEKGMQIPIIVGGATASALHTAVKLAPLYSFCVLYGGDASRTSVLSKKLIMSPEETIAGIKAEQKKLRDLYDKKNRDMLSYDEANRCRCVVSDFPGPDLVSLKKHECMKPGLEYIADYIDWKQLLFFWGFKGPTLQDILQNGEAVRTLEDARTVLGQMKSDSSVEVGSILEFHEARSHMNDIFLDNGYVLPMLRSQSKSNGCLCLADFIPENGKGNVGLFCITARDRIIHEDEKSYDCLMRQAICARLAEAAVEWIQKTVFGDMNVIRPAFGYPSCPDHSLKRELFDMLDAENRLGIELTDNYSIKPSTSICGMFIAHPEARYFNVGETDDEQKSDYETRKAKYIR